MTGGLQEPKTECAQRGDLEGSLQHTAESPEAGTLGSVWEEEGATGKCRMESGGKQPEGSQGSGGASL